MKNSVRTEQWTRSAAVGNPNLFNSEQEELKYSEIQAKHANAPCRENE
jgi:hypothetical protein